MSNIRRAFEKGKAFIPFITCGDPSLAVTEELACAMAEAGADLIELAVNAELFFFAVYGAVFESAVRQTVVAGLVKRHLPGACDRSVGKRQFGARRKRLAA